MEFFDVVDETGKPTGEIISRDKAHDKGVLHKSVHIWVIREKGGTPEVLLQRRSDVKESFPGMFDTSSAGHVSAGEDAVTSAVREMSEELGIKATPDQLYHIGTIHIKYEKVFHGRLYRDNELAEVYVYEKIVENLDHICKECGINYIAVNDRLRILLSDPSANRQIPQFLIPNSEL